jgi:hypothetical protein
VKNRIIPSLEEEAMYGLGPDGFGTTAQDQSDVEG